jgi:hypothetical protein
MEYVFQYLILNKFWLGFIAGGWAGFIINGYIVYMAQNKEVKQ